MNKLKFKSKGKGKDKGKIQFGRELTLEEKLKELVKRVEILEKKNI